LHDKNERSRPLVYPTMTVAEIEAMPVASVSDKDAHLYLWTINRYVENAYSVARAWGFEPSTLLVWAKRPKGRGLGETWPTFTEYCLFARRGTLKATTRGPSNWWTWTRGKHSAKPEAFQDMVETVSPGPRLELFARRARPGWTVWGNEVEANAPGHFRPDNGDNSLHPCQKPVDLLAWLVNGLTVEGETVCDPFMGSGSVGVACIRTGRRFVGIERDPAHFATARQRLENELRQGLLPLTPNKDAVP
jgi:N6-adenosine-specific RNA methylase IME4